jgi:iron complex transport system substrate-binding protein
MELRQIAERYAGTPPARVLLLLGTLSDPPQPPFAAGPGSFYDDLLRLARHTNVVDAGTRAFGPLSLEMIVRADPEVIIELDADGTGRPAGEADALKTWAQLGSLQAVAQRRVHVLKGQHHFIPGPRLAQSFEELCRAIAEPGHD